MPRRFRLRIESRVATDAARVWAVVSTMDGVNAELAPVHMSAPPGAAIDAHVPLGRPAFTSWITWRRLVPLDRHELTLVRVEPGVGFDEASRSWLEATWQHHRRLLPDGAAACTVVDEVVFAPRLGWLAPLVCRIVARTFERRHRRLRERFGGAAAAGAPHASIAPA